VTEVRVRVPESRSTTGATDVCERGTPGLSRGVEYPVFAISVCRGTAFVLLESNLRVPSWYPLAELHVTDSAIPNDWIVGSAGAEVPIVIGPRWISSSREAYESLANLEPLSLDLFRRDAGHSRS
jgi:hypothetical protein